MVRDVLGTFGHDNLTIGLSTMTSNQRIILNFLATYGRSVYALLLGLFSTRWVLKALGRSDLGLFGVVGSIIVVIGFLNGILGGAVSRYYAFAIGEAEKIGEERGNEYIIRWFNAAVSIHFIVPSVLCAIGYPLGIYAIRNWLVIPDGRVNACEIVFALSLLSAFISMVAVPYISMYRAKQLIAELSVWGVLQTTCLFIGAYILMNLDSDRLIVYAAMMTSIPGLITIFQIYRAWRSFGVCHIRFKYLFDRKYLAQLFSYSFWEIFASGGDVVRTQGTSFLINRNFGPDLNAAWSVSCQVSGHTTALSSALIGSLTPALTTAAGAGEKSRMESLAFATCKFGSFLILLFAIPLILEMDNVLTLWLVDPPPYTSIMCRCILIALVLHKLGMGHHMAILANGSVAKLLMTTGFISTSSILIVWGMIRMGLGALGIGLSFIISYGLLTVARVYWAKRQIGLSVCHWIKRIVLPIVFVSCVSYSVGEIPMALLDSSFLRICLTSGITLLCTTVLGWFVVLNKQEHMRLYGLLGKLFK